MAYLKWKRLFSISCGILTSRLLSYFFRWAKSPTYFTFCTNKVDIILFLYQMFFRMLLPTYGRGHLWLSFLQLLVTIQNKDWQCMVSQRLLSLVSQRYMFICFFFIFHFVCCNWFLFVSSHFSLYHFPVALGIGGVLHDFFRVPNIFLLKRWCFPTPKFFLEGTNKAISKSF